MLCASPSPPRRPEITMTAAPRSLSLLAHAALGAAILAAAGCQGIPEPPGRNSKVLFAGSLEEVRPMDVVVAPIIDQSVEGEVPLLELRQAFQRHLIRRRYSALSLPYTDRRVVNASYQPGALYEDAILQVTVREWDLSRFDSNGELGARIEAWMLSAEDETELWGGQLEKTFYLANDLQNMATTKGALGIVAEDIAAELLEVLPARTPRP